MNASLTAAALALVPAVLGTLVLTILSGLVLGIPLSRARRRIFLEVEEQFLTSEVIEREMARRHPKLYSLNLYIGYIQLGAFALIYVFSFLFIVLWF